MKDLNFITCLPSPLSISYMWNFGSLLGVSLVSQVLTGLFLSMHYSASMVLSFDSVVHITQDVNYGWMIRFGHANGATLFFFLMYVHIARGLFYKSYALSKVWMVGVLMFLLFMMVAFLGYVLPWGQMSYWGATVITNLISALPYVGSTLVEWLWGGFSVSDPTLVRFFSLHFFLPLLGVTLVVIHLSFLHETGSSNPLGLMINSDKIAFHPLFTVKDLIGLLGWGLSLAVVCLVWPFNFMDPDNFVAANPMVTPVHIQPEWYFLFAYAILRSIPNKLGGVLALVLSVLVLSLFPVLSKKEKSSSASFFYQVFSFCLFSVFVLLTWAGSLPVEFPYLESSKILSIGYFTLLLIMMMI